MIINIYVIWKRSYVMYTVVCKLSLNILETALGQTLGECLNDKPQTPWLNSISNAASLSLKLLLSTGQNVSSKNWLHDLFLMKISHLTMIFHSQTWIGYTLGEKRTGNNVTFHKTNDFYLNVWRDIFLK